MTKVNPKIFHLWLAISNSKVKNRAITIFVFWWLWFWFGNSTYVDVDIPYHGCVKRNFLHDWSWISPWIQSISNELDIIIQVIASQLSCHCDVTSNRFWRHHQNENRASETRGRCVKLVVLYSFMDSLCRVRNKIMYVLSWRTVSALTRALFLVYIHTKITLSWALKRFVTRVHTLFPM